MKKADIVDFFMYHQREVVNPLSTTEPMSDELKTAIQHLIDRLRDLGPIK